jgi:enoyl-[acyl-carrier-protein] reductase (NADH)
MTMPIWSNCEERLYDKTTGSIESWSRSDIGNTVALLASDDARNITGQSINVDGGYKLT